jgi:hypothetical protein
MITVGFEQTRGFSGNPHELVIGTVPVPTGGTVFAGMGMGTTKYTRGLPVSCLSHVDFGTYCTVGLSITGVYRSH